MTLREAMLASCFDQHIKTKHSTTSHVDTVFKVHWHGSWTRLTDGSFDEKAALDYVMDTIDKIIEYDKQRQCDPKFLAKGQT